MPFILLPFDERDNHSYAWQDISQWDFNSIGEVPLPYKGFVSRRELQWQRRENTFRFFQGLESTMQMSLLGTEPGVRAATKRIFLKLPRQAEISGLEGPGLFPEIFGDRDRDNIEQTEFSWEIDRQDMRHFFRLGENRDLYRELYPRSSQRLWISKPLHFYCYTWWKRIKRSRLDFHERTVVLALMEEVAVYDKSGEWNAALRLNDDDAQRHEMMSTIVKDVWKKRYTFYKQRSAPTTRNLQRYWEFFYFDSEWNYTKSNSSYNNAIYPGAHNYFREVMNRIDLQEGTEE